MRNCLTACGGEANCVGMFTQRLNELDGFLILARLEIIQLRPSGICVACRAAVFARHCDNSSLPFMMCDRELWNKWRMLSAVSQADIDVQMSALEPTNSSSEMFLKMVQGYGRSFDRCWVGFCSDAVDQKNVTIARIQSLAGFLNNRTLPYFSDLGCTMTTRNYAQLKDAWEGSWVVGA